MKIKNMKIKNGKWKMGNESVALPRAAGDWIGISAFLFFIFLYSAAS